MTKPGIVFGKVENWPYYCLLGILDEDEIKCKKEKEEEEEGKGMRRRRQLEAGKQDPR